MTKDRRNKLRSSRLTSAFIATLAAATFAMILCGHAQQIGDRIYSPVPFGNYLSMAHTNWPPTPFLPIPEAPVYYLGTINGQPGYAYDDRDTENGFAPQ